MNTLAKSQKPPKAKERKMDCELTSVSHGSHDDSHDSHDDSHDSLARCLALCQDPLIICEGTKNTTITIHYY